MHHLPRASRHVLGFFTFAALALAACATPRAVVEKRDDGILHLKCPTPLSECLEQASIACDRGKYAVLRAIDDPDLKAAMALTSTLYPGSEAYVRCGSAHSLGVENQLLLSQPLCPAPAAAPSAPPTSTRACVPGASQACVGPGGCHGGQSCAADGASYAPCDCGPAPSAPASPTP
jgi:hypothetical protein